MMGRSHAISGGAGWLAGCALLDLTGMHPSAITVTDGAAVSTGMALLPRRSGTGGRA